VVAVVVDALLEPVVGSQVAVVVDQPETVVAGDTWVVAVARQVAAVPSCLDHPGHIATRSTLVVPVAPAVAEVVVVLRFPRLCLYIVMVVVTTSPVKHTIIRVFWLVGDNC